MAFSWPPRKRGNELVVVLPTSNVSYLPDLRSKTYFIGLVGRALAIYRVSKLVLFKDPHSSMEDLNLIRLVLTYLLTPPYLRKRLIPLVPELRYCGVLPPLNIVTHNPEGRDLRVGDLREGLVIQSLGKLGKVFIGYRRLCLTTSKRELGVNDRVLVRVTSLRPLKCEVVNDKEVNEYLGFKMLIAKDKDELVSTLNSIPGVTVLTTKLGDSIGKLGTRKALIKAGREAGGFKILFGSYDKDFDELVGPETLNALSIRFRINFIPNQGTLTVRTIEALYSVLSIINADYETFRY